MDYMSGCTVTAVLGRRNPAPLHSAALAVLVAVGWWALTERWQQMAQMAQMAKRQKARFVSQDGQAANNRA